MVALTVQLAASQGQLAAATERLADLAAAQVGGRR